MKPPPLRYLRPETLDDALRVLADNEDAKVLAGGQSLVPALNMRLIRPVALIDINRVGGLDNVASENGTLVVGATVRQADPRLRRHRLLADALPHVGHFVTRNRGTVAGSIAHADPAAELAVCLLLLGGAVVARSARAEREITAADFFAGPYTTALASDELVVATRWPLPGDGVGLAFVEFAQRHGDYALAMAAASVEGDEIRVAVGSVAGRPLPLEVDPEHAGESAAAQIEPWATVHASPAYLRHLVAVLVDRAVAHARERTAA